MDIDQIKAQIDADMASTVTMTFGQLTAYLSTYTAKFSNEILAGTWTRAGIRAYADTALARAQKESE
jgi:hypothetical protein